MSHRATIVDPTGIGALLRAIDGFDGQPTTRAALRLAAYVFVRPGELRHAEWKEFDLDNADLDHPGREDENAPPTSCAASAATTGHSPRIAGNHRERALAISVGTHVSTRPISENTLNAALRRLGYDSEAMSTHGFRGNGGHSVE